MEFGTFMEFPPLGNAGEWCLDVFDAYPLHQGISVFGSGLG